MEIKNGEIVLCKFYFSSLKSFKNRPVLIFKDNLPFDDFLGIPISSKIEKLQNDELLIDNSCFVEGKIPKKSKIMLRKPFTISKKNIIKRYGKIKEYKLKEIKKFFCKYYECN